MSKKIRVGVLFGGRSAEHEVSLVSAASIIKALDHKKYEIIPIGITKAGEWLVGRPMKALTERKFNNIHKVMPPTNPNEKGLIKSKSNSKVVMIGPIDVFFPVLHGPFGEDGTIQGLLELTNIPYVGANLLSSALGMDKVAQKLLYQQTGIPTPKFISFKKFEWQKNQRAIIKQIKKNINFPCFVKPANLGSSVGISKVHAARQLTKAVILAFEYDLKIIVEKSIEEAREIEVAILGNNQPRVSVLGEIIPSNEFYDYDAKYIDGQSQAIIPAKIPVKIAKKVQEYALKAFKILDCSGMARADFLITKKRYQIYLNEINTIPGFTTISMYPKLWQATGLKYQTLLDKLINLALERQKQKKFLQTSYLPKTKWYR